MSESVANDFAINLLKPELNETEEETARNVQQLTSHTPTLPSGPTVKDQYFDTDMHVNWDKELLKSISTKAWGLIEKAQKDTDAFTTHDPTISWAISFSSYGLQTHSPSHFDNNNISGGIDAIRGRYLDGITNFNKTKIDESAAHWLGPINPHINQTNYLLNPGFEGDNAGVQLLLYRFGQIAHAFEDFYSHSNWVELAKNNLLPGTLLFESPSKPAGWPAWFPWPELKFSSKLFDDGLYLPAELKPGNFIGNTDVMLAQSGPSWSGLLKRSGTGDYFDWGGKVNVYWNVDSTNPDNSSNSKVAVVSATTLDGRKVYGLASGAVNGILYPDKDHSVFLRDPNKTGFFEKEYFRGFSHGGLAGAIAGQWVSPLNKDKESSPNHLYARRFATLQSKHEWDRMGYLIYSNYGVTGLNKFANYVFDSPKDKDAYVQFYNPKKAPITTLPIGGGSEITLNSHAESSNVPQKNSSPEALGFTGVPVSLDNNVQLDIPGDHISDDLKIRLVKIYGEAYVDTSEPFASGKYGYQYFDATSRKWLDTDYINLTIHDELDATVASKITTPSVQQHSLKGERIMWATDSITSINGAATNFYIELTNQENKVYLNNFDMHHDRVIFLDDSGGEIKLNEKFYDSLLVDKLVVELSRYGVIINFKPEISSKPDVVLVSEQKLASPLVIEAKSFASDPLGRDILFTDYDQSLPFLKLDQGKLVANSIASEYLGKKYTVNASITNGNSILQDVPISIALAPKVEINGDSYDSQSNFKLSFSNLDSSSLSIYSRLSDQANSPGFFTLLSSSIDGDSPMVQGFDAFSLDVTLTDELGSGAIDFWLEDSAGQFVPLKIESTSKGNYKLLYSSGQELAQLNYLNNGLGDSTPIAHSVAIGDELFDGLGFDLNQSFFDLDPEGRVKPWNVSLSLDLYREAVKDNIVGFYLFDEYEGGILDPLTGDVVQANNHSDWSEIIEKYAVWTGSTDNQSPRSFVKTFDINALVDPDSLTLLPFFISTAGSFKTIYSSFDSLNPGGVSMITELSRNSLGFEDIHTSNSDLDFNDLIVRLNSITLI